MTTQTDVPTGQRLEKLLAGHRALGWGLFWAAAMLGVLALWVANKHPSLGIVLWGPTLLLAAAALVSGVWALVQQSRAQGASPAEAEAILLRQRRLLGLGLLGGAAVLLLLGLWLTFQQGLAAFPEVSTMVVLALVGLGAGLVAVSPPQRWPDRERLMQGLLRVRQKILVGLLAAAGVSAALALWAFLEVGVGPDFVAAALLTLLFFGVGLWQLLMLPEQADVQTMRLLVLVGGGGLGLVLALAALLRGYVWWTQGMIFAADTPMAESPGLWRLWLCAYVEIFGLALLFGSLLLGRTDIRQNPVMRRVLFGYNSLLTGVLVLAALVLFNVAVYVTYPYTLEWTQSQGLHSLSDLSKNVLRGLKKPVYVYAILSGNSRAYRDSSVLLENAQAYTRLLRVHYVSPDKDESKYLELIKEFPVLRQEATTVQGMRNLQSGGLLLVYGASGPVGGARPPHEFIPSRDLQEDTEMSRQGKQQVVFKGEQLLINKLRLLSESGNKPKIYFTQGNRELNLLDDRVKDRTIDDDRGGAGLLLQRLKKDNYEVRGLLWTAAPARQKGPAEQLMTYARAKPQDKPEVPADAKVVIIAYPQLPLDKEALAALDRYVERGGKLLVLDNPTVIQVGPRRVAWVDTGLEEFLRKYGVGLGKDFLIRVPGDLRRESPVLVLATTPRLSRNKVAEAFRDVRFPLGGDFEGQSVGPARSVRPSPVPGKFKAEPLLQVTPELNKPFWVESTNVGLLYSAVATRNYVAALRAQGEVEDKATSEPVPVAVAVQDAEGRPRLAVFGDARFASNLFVEGPAPYYDFLTSTIEWLVERPSNIGVQPRVSGTFEIRAEDVNTRRLIWLPLGLVMLFFTGLGLGLWVVRRR
jgi:hypothetical protein